MVGLLPDGVQWFDNDRRIHRRAMQMIWYIKEFWPLDIGVRQSSPNVFTMEVGVAWASSVSSGLESKDTEVFNLIMPNTNGWGVLASTWAGNASAVAMGIAATCSTTAGSMAGTSMPLAASSSTISAVVCSISSAITSSSATTAASNASCSPGSHSPPSMVAQGRDWAVTAGGQEPPW